MIVQHPERMFVELTLNLALGQNSEWRPKRF